MKRRQVSILFLLVFLGAGCGFINEKPIPLTETRGTPEHTPFWDYEGWVIARGSMHNHTTYSDGCRTPDDLVKQARNEGIAVLGITDHREGNICAGKKGKVCFTVGGVDSKEKGYKKYLADLDRLSQESKSPIVLAGLEVAPYIWREEDAPKLLLKGNNWHFTVYGIDDPAVFENMPVTKSINLKETQDPGPAPYNKFVNYIRDAGGIVFQAHPQWVEVLLGQHRFRMPSPINLTDQLPRLNGVAIIPEGFNAGEPGGKWDQGLMQYLAGYRGDPFWTWGDADFECPESHPQGLRTGTTLFYLRHFSREDVFHAIKTGRMVALMGKDFQEVFVSEFSIGEGRVAKEKIMLGEEVRLNAAPLIRFSLSKVVPVKETRLIRNGTVIYTTKSTRFSYLDKDSFSWGKPCYYRVQVTGEGQVELDNANLIYTNPVFVDFR